MEPTFCTVFAQCGMKWNFAHWNKMEQQTLRISGTFKLMVSVLIICKLFKQALMMVSYFIHVYCVLQLLCQLILCNVNLQTLRRLLTGCPLIEYVNIRSLFFTYAYAGGLSRLQLSLPYVKLVLFYLSLILFSSSLNKLYCFLLLNYVYLLTLWNDAFFLYLDFGQIRRAHVNSISSFPFLPSINLPISSYFFRRCSLRSPVHIPPVSSLSFPVNPWIVLNFFPKPSIMFRFIYFNFYYY